MNNVYYDPWRGKYYPCGGIFEKRILVLGESHHGKDTGKNMTKDIIYEQCYSCYTMPAYTKFERALVGSTTNNILREKIWNSVAFYNYVQECISKPRKSPTKKQFDDSEAAFFEVLETLKPDVVLVWGSRLYDAMPYSNSKTGPNYEYEGYSYRSCFYNLVSGLSIPCYEMQHPSSGFSWKWWHGFLMANRII